MRNIKQYNDYIKESILINNQFGISEVKNFEDLKSTYLIREDYSKIVELIKTGGISSIKNLQEKEIKTSEYLNIIKFLDQGNVEYIVTCYDSDDLWQVPQVIDIFKL